MRILIAQLLVLSLISFLSGCASVSGNVVPQKGPAMEQVYDSMSDSDQPEMNQVVSENKEEGQIDHDLPRSSVDRSFHKLPNPELKMYVFPHLAGKDEVPVPGYFTEFSAYERNHYEPI